MTGTDRRTSFRALWHYNVIVTRKTAQIIWRNSPLRDAVFGGIALFAGSWVLLVIKGPVWTIPQLGVSAWMIVATIAGLLMLAFVYAAIVAPVEVDQSLRSALASYVKNETTARNQRGAAHKRMALLYKSLREIAEKPATEHSGGVPGWDARYRSLETDIYRQLQTMYSAGEAERFRAIVSHARSETFEIMADGDSEDSVRAIFLRMVSDGLMQIISDNNLAMD